MDYLESLLDDGLKTLAHAGGKFSMSLFPDTMISVSVARAHSLPLSLTSPQGQRILETLPCSLLEP